MNKDELQDYGNWIGKTPVEIRGHVIRNGGWSKVFPAPMVIPKWLHRVRNYFNRYPKSLVRVGDRDAKRVVNAVNLRSEGTIDWWLARGASSGDVYQEPNGTYWIEMSQSGSQFHSEEQFNPLTSAVLPHAATGNFKLVCPDKTGGSWEAALHNWKSGLTGLFGKNSAAKVGQWVDAETQAITTEIYRGSYNFADTMVSGYAEHKRFDMDPDETYGLQYLNEGRWTPIGERVFAPITEIEKDKLGVDPKMAGLPLSQKTQQMILMLYRKRMPVSEIAANLNCTVQDAQKIVNRVYPDLTKGWSGGL